MKSIVVKDGMGFECEDGIASLVSYSGQEDEVVPVCFEKGIAEELLSKGGEAPSRIRRPYPKARGTAGKTKSNA